MAATSLVVALLVLLALGASAVARTPKGFFGVVPQGQLTDRDFEAMGDARVGTLRFRMDWAGIDKTSASDDYDWSEPDYLVGHAARNGARALPFVYGTPDWVAKLDGAGCGGDCGPYAPRRGAALKEWRRFLEAAVGRYGRGGEFWDEHPEIPEEPIRAWQLWNEQNSPTFYRPKPKPKTYLKLVSAGRKAITSVDGKAEIVLGGMFATPRQGRKPAIASWRYLRKLYRLKGARKSFDGVAAHPYAPTFDNVVAQVKLLRDAMKAAGDRKAELWITEIGWSSARGGNPLNRGPKGQAKSLKRAFKYFTRKRRALKIPNVNWFSWRDSAGAGAGICDWCPDSGLLKEDYDPKPSLRAFTRFAGGS